MPIDQKRLDLARAVGLLRMEERFRATGTAAQKAAVATEIAEHKKKAPAEYTKAEQMFKVEQAKNTPALKDKAWAAEVKAEKDDLKKGLGPRNATPEPVDLTVKSDELAKLLSDSPGSSFTKVYSVFFDYENEEDPKKKQKLLQTLERRAERWVIEHKGSKRQLDVDRSDLLAKLVEQASFEQARFSQGEAQKRYMANIANAPGDVNNPDPDVKFGFKGLTKDSRDNVRDNVLAPGGPQQRKYVDPPPTAPKGTMGTWVSNKIPNPYKLTIGEIAAIQTFTGPDYGSINPATANSKERLDANRAKHIGDAFVTNASDKDYMSEGVIHVGMAMSGLRKLPPYTGGPVYRGISATQAEFDNWRTNGYIQASLGSASTDRATSEGFADMEQGPLKPLAVLLVLNNAEGRDISHISVKPHENEVIILAGTKFNVNSTQQLPAGPKGPCWEIVLTKA
jgi:hypothetical protein